VLGLHGDIKPANLLWFPNHKDENDMGIIKISDFGSSQFKVCARASTPSTGHSPPYRPPEFDLHEFDSVTTSSGDIWSLGCVFLEFVTWYIGGSELLGKLDGLRGKTSEEGYVDESRAFFEISKQPDGRRTAMVKPGITDVRHSPKDNCL